MNFPNIQDGIIGFDIESRDPALIEEGPGWARGYGNLVGVSIAVPGHAWYFPLRHTVEPEDNLEIEPTLRYLKDLLENPKVGKVGANLLYDIGWMTEEGIEVQGDLFDVQFAEALLVSNTRQVSLDYLAQKYLGRHKVKTVLDEWCESRYKGFKDHRANIYRAPPRIVTKYAEADAELPLLIFDRQIPLLRADNLEQVFSMECDLIPMLVKMRQRGMPVDLIKAEEAREHLKYAEKFQHKALNDMAGFRVNVNSRNDLPQLFDKFKIQYPRTAKGNPSFKGAWLEEQHHPVATLVKEIRGLQKARSTFVENAVIEKSIRGKIYPGIHPLRSDSGGTITGRFSSSQPNAQQIPARDKEMSQLIRGIFIPEDGFNHICSIDFSQIEYRMLAHFVAIMLGDTTLVDKYTNPSTDFHKVVGDMLGVDEAARKAIKQVNFMKLYGGGVNKTAELLHGLDSDLTPKQFIKLYDERFPQANAMMSAVTRMIQTTGEVRTLLNRRTLFDTYTPVGKHGMVPLPYNKAYYTYGPNIEVANTYKGLNYLLQGSAADYMKMAMLHLHNDGILDKVGYPHITVHDELTWSYNRDLKKEFLYMKEIMQDAIPLRLPMLADVEIGSDWGSCNNAV